MSAAKGISVRPGPSVLAVMTRAKVLVTSSAGHLGEVLARVLRGRGYQVTGQDLRASPGTDVTASITDRPWCGAR
jgi:nucleoside-diphosphate-sugar epimerase